LVTTESPQFLVVPGLHEARSLVFATWLRSFQANSSFARPISREVFFPAHQLVLERLLARPNVEVHLAVWPDDPNVVFGWSVTEGDCVHYVYVKPDFRKAGLARALLAHRPFAQYSHHTYVLRDLHPKIAHLTYNPYRML
jgi:GNAT superfamily N-acetyltransferase